MFKRIMSVLAILAVSAAPTWAQLNLTYTSFQPGQSISAAQFTANFTAISANALNRTGGTMSGTLELDSSFIIGSGNLQPFDSTGKIKEISSTYFANLAGTNISAIPEANISDGTIFPRLNANEIITGSWTHPNITISTAGAARAYFVDSSATVDNRRWEISSSAGSWTLLAVNDAITSSTAAVTVVRSGINISSINLGGNTSITGTLSASGGVTFQAGVAVTGNVGAATASLTGDLALGGNITDTAGISIRSTVSGEYANLEVTGNALDGFTRPTFIFSSLDGGTTRTSFQITPVAVYSRNFYPIFDNSETLGAGDYRWTAVFATTGAVSTSDARLKRDIKDTELGIEFIDALKPKEYFWRDSKLPGKYYGFVAQDLVKLGFEGVDSTNPNRLGLRYTELIAPIVKGMQEMHEEIHIMERVNKMQAAQINMLAERIIELEKGYGTSRKAD